MEERKTRQPRIFFGWWIVISNAISFLYGGGTWFYGFGAFFNPIRTTFGWNYTQTSLAFSLQRLESGGIGPIVGYLTDRLGPRKMQITGRIIIAIGIFYLSQCDSLMTFYIGFMIVAFGNGVGFGVTGSTAIGNWFVRKRSTAIAVGYVGYGLSGILVPLLVWLVSVYGWRSTLIIVGIGYLVITVPLAFFQRHKPEQYGYLPDGDTILTSSEDAQPDVADDSALVKPEIDPGKTTTEEDYTARDALKSQAFWFLAIGMSLGFMGQGGLVVHEIPYLESVGISTEIAGLAVTGLTLFSIIGRLGFGVLGDKYDKRKMLAVAFGLQLIGLVIFANITQPWHILAFLAFYGPGYGGPIPLRPALLGEYFGRRAFGTIQGLTFFVQMWPGIVAPLFAGWVFDSTGSYPIAFYAFAATIVVAVPFILAIKKPQKADAKRLEQAA